MYTAYVKLTIYSAFGWGMEMQNDGESNSCSMFTNLKITPSASWREEEEIITISIARLAAKDSKCCQLTTMPPLPPAAAINLRTPEGSGRVSVTPGKG